MSTPSLAGSNGSKPEAIAERIRAAILEHRLAPGAKLTEAQLCEVFGVKRGPIRQALALLATDRLVDLEPNRGAFVASPSLQEVHEVFEMRRIIELAVVERICAGHGPRRLKNMGSMIGRERKAFETRDFSAWIRLSGEFHTALRLPEWTGCAFNLDFGFVRIARAQPVFVRRPRSDSRRARRRRCQRGGGPDVAPFAKRRTEDARQAGPRRSGSARSVRLTAGKDRGSLM